MVMRGSIAAFLTAFALLAPLPMFAQGILEQMQDEVATIVSRARPAIVSIEDERFFGGPRGRPADSGRGKPEGPRSEPDKSQPPQRARRPMGEPPRIGSGFSIGDGFIVTTADVLMGMKSPMVLTEDGRRIRATISGVDPEMNIGVLKLTSTSALPGLKLGRSSTVYPGHFAISIGNQYGHLNSVALTLVAGIRDDGIPAGEHFYPGLIQIAGTVAAGTSGAPILNARGEVVGMIAGIPSGDWPPFPFPGNPSAAGRPGQTRGPAGSERSRGLVDATIESGQGAGSPPANSTGPAGDPRFVFIRPPFSSAGFALPIDDMKPVLSGLRQGKLVHCWLGLDMKEERKRVESDGVVTWKRSVYVSTVYPNSPASAAGFQVGDTFTSVNSRPINRLINIRAALLRAQPGDSMEFKLERKGAMQTVTAHLAVRPEAPTPSPAAKH